MEPLCHNLPLSEEEEKTPNQNWEQETENSEIQLSFKEKKQSEESQNSQSSSDTSSSDTSLQLVKKASILKRKKPKILHDPLSKSLSVKKMYLLGEIIVLNEDSIKEPQQSRESLIINSLHFNRITSLCANDQFMTLNLKRNQANYLTHRYMIDRFRSFNDKKYKELADSLETIFSQEQFAKQRIAQLRHKMGNEQFLEKVQKMRLEQQSLMEKMLLNEYKDRKYVALYYSEGVNGQSLEKIVISTSMLDFTGNKLSDFINAFAKKKTLSFELIGTSVYQKVFVTGSKERAEALKKRRLENPDDYKFYVEQKQETKSKEVNLPSQIYRKKQNDELEWEEKIKCKMTFSKPLRSVKLFLFGQAEEKPIAVFNKKTKNIKLLKS